MNSAGGHKVPTFYDAFGRRLAEISLISHRPSESQELHTTTSVLEYWGSGFGDLGIGAGIKSTASAAVAVKCKLFMKWRIFVCPANYCGWP